MTSPRYLGFYVHAHDWHRQETAPALQPAGGSRLLKSTEGSTTTTRNIVVDIRKINATSFYQPKGVASKQDTGRDDKRDVLIAHSQVVGATDKESLW